MVSYKSVLPVFLLFWIRCLPGILFSEAGEATTAATKEVQFSGWKPLAETEALSTDEFVEQFPDLKKVNETDSETAETRKSFLLVYPPRSASQEQPSKPNVNDESQTKNANPPLRAYPTQSRYTRMMSFAASEGNNKRAPGVYERPKFPPVANPPPLPPHARRHQSKPSPNYKPEPTSQHQVQIQLLDGYLVPPAAGGFSTIQAKDKRAPLTTFPLNLNNVPEIRLLLPGDVHQQLNNLQQPAPQQNQAVKSYPESQGQGAPNHASNNHRNQDYHNVEGKIPNLSFESQRYSDTETQRHQLPSNNNNNYESGNKQLNYDRNNQRQPENGFSQPDASNYGNTVHFPAHPNVQETANNHGQTYENVRNLGNGRPHNQDFQLDARAPVKDETFSNDQSHNVIHPNRENYNQDFQIDSRAPPKTQSFSNIQRDAFNPNTGNYNQNGRQQFHQPNHQTGGFPPFANEPQRGENFRPLSNGNYQQNYFNNIPSIKGSRQVVNNQYNNNQNLGQNAWRGQPSYRGKQNNRILPPEKQNFYNVNGGNLNQNIKSQPGYQNAQQPNNFNYGGLDQTIKKVTNPTNNNQPNNLPDNFNQQNILKDIDVYDSTQPSGGRQTPTTQTISTQQVLIEGRNVTQVSPTEEVYFVPQVPTQNDIQTQVSDIDVSTPGDTTFGTETISTNTVRDSTPFTQQEEFETLSDGITGGSVIGNQVSNLVDRNGFCDCSQNCAPIQRLPSEDFGSSIREIARSLNADAFFEFIGLSDNEIESMLSTEGPYTLFIPSNEAVSRLPSNLIDQWKQNNPDFTMALLNHLIQDTVSLSQLKQGGRLTSRANAATIFVNNYNNEAVTVNGHRIVHGDVTAPKGGVIHVIDGTLCPVADQDVINTLRTCNKYDGFLTLADVTKLLDTMQDDGPYTVFLPSNDALTKIPNDELAVLKENVTLLRDFLDYHIVQGAYFSGDLKDGQYLTTLHQKQPIRVGIRVDGCHRRLVEANNSPLFKADIPTKNGVIHVLDWILRPSDLNWCEGVILP